MVTSQEPMAQIRDAGFFLYGRGMLLGSVANFCLDSFPVWVISQYSLELINWSEFGAYRSWRQWMIHQDFAQFKTISCITLQLMMAAVSDDSNRNCGAAMEVGGDERISSNLISRLLLLSDPIFLFGVRSW